ncbi:MAG: hypothetical protein GX051_06870 [Clostridiales bacterium]|nr:hypothetical protein [Clostridiales bacterium]
MKNAENQIVNIINFIRGCEPRCEVDLKKPVFEQLKLLKKHGFRGTFLIQYDALVSEDFADVREELKASGHEIGVWLEIVKPLAEEAALEWRGRYPWDWHADVGFSVGYTLEERGRLIDTLFHKFKEVFGYYPRVMGSWIIDAHTLKYASDKYGLDATCNCKDQWGTDGYTLWGAYYNQAYYPSINNVFCPAGSKKTQIDVPLFRMLGSDPVYQYDAGLDLNDGAADIQGVVTLEPVYCGNGGGGNPEWVDWYLAENFNGKCLAFSYTQAGQENSFGWDAMRDGLIYQFECFEQLKKDKKITVETLGESGRKYKAKYPLTVPTAVTAESDWLESGKKSVWYSCKNYRINIFCEDNTFFIRDAHVFDDAYRERYFDEICRDPVLKFDNLPLVDGNRWSGNGVRAGLFFLKDGETLTYTDMLYEEPDLGTAKLTFCGTECGDVILILSEDSVRITVSRPEGFSLDFRHGKNALLPEVISDNNNYFVFRHNGYEYGIEQLVECKEKVLNISFTRIFSR